MKSTFKTSLLGFLIATALAGCASAPQAPKDAKEMAALGEDNLLHVPVDVSNFPWKKLEIEATNGDKGRITVFTDPATGKTYDLDGQPVNEKGERILKDGYVCKVEGIFVNQRVYGRAGFWTETAVDKFCKTSLKSAQQNRGQTIMAVGILTGGIAALAAMPLNATVAHIVSDDTI